MDLVGNERLYSLLSSHTLFEFGLLRPMFLHTCPFPNLLLEILLAFNHHLQSSYDGYVP